MCDPEQAPTGQERQARIRARSLERRERRRADLRRQILEAATRVFVNEGLDGFSMSQVAEAIGYSTPTIYLHFRDREDLLFAVIWQGYLGMTGCLEEAFDSTKDPLPRIRQILRAYLRYAMDNPAHYRAYFMATTDWITRLTEQARKLEATGGSTPRAVFAAAAREAIRAGAMGAREESEVVDLLWTLVHGLASLFLTAPVISTRWERSLVEQRLEKWTDVMLAGLQV